MADSSRISVAVEEVASASADPDPPTLAEGCARRSRWVAAFVACATLLMAGAVGVAGERRVEQGETLPLPSGSTAFVAKAVPFVVVIRRRRRRRWRRWLGAGGPAGPSRAAGGDFRSQAIQP